MRASVQISALALAMTIALAAAADASAQERPAPAAAALDHADEMAGIDLDSKLFGHSVFGGGYADFVSSGAPGENSYWVFAQGLGRFAFGRWYADVFIDFGNFQYDFRALYSVDCIEVNRATREAWIDGTVIESNLPTSVGRRAFLYIKDGGGIGGDDFHAITPLVEGVKCTQRPQPNFMERAQSGNYYIER